MMERNLVGWYESTWKKQLQTIIKRHLHRACCQGLFKTLKRFYM